MPTDESEMPANAIPGWTARYLGSTRKLSLNERPGVTLLQG